MSRSDALRWFTTPMFLFAVPRYQLSVSLIAVLCGGLLHGNVLGQTAVWEQKFEIFDSTCDPNGGGPPIIEFAAGPDGDLYFSDPGNLYRSIDNGSTWEISPFDLVHVEGILPLSAGDLLIGLYGDGIYRLTDHGASWSQTNVTEPVWELIANDERSLIFAVAVGGGLYVSTDRGETWDLTQPEWSVSAVRIGPHGRVYVFADDTYVSDDGFSWEKLSSSRFPFPTGAANILLATDPEGVYRSESNGQSWELALSMNEPALLRNNEGVLVAVSRAGDVHLSEDDGESWNPMISGSPLPCGVRSTASVDDDGHIWLGSNVGVIFRSSMTTHVASDQVTAVPEAQSLDVYPNPTSSGVDIVVLRERPGSFDLRVYDVIGREVHSFHSEIQGVDEARFSWNTIDLPAGVYFVRLETGRAVTTRLVTVAH